MAEELAEELALAVAPEHPGVPSPIPLPRSASRHWWESVRPRCRSLPPNPFLSSLEALHVLAVSTGLRQGELLALRWEDVDLEAAVLRVSRTLTRNGGKVSVGPPKTKNSRRTVGLTDGAVEALGEHLTQQLEEMESVGSLYRPGGLVFANEVGGIVNLSNLRNRSLKALLKRAGLPAIRFHDLRHTCATLLFSRNVNPKIVSEMLGHASIAITLDTYSHVLPNMQQSAVRALEEASSNAWRRVAARLLHGGPGAHPRPPYTPCFCAAKWAFFPVGLPGLEPGTSSLSEKRSNHLSYRPGVIDATDARHRDNVQHAHAPDNPIAGPGGGK